MPATKRPAGAGLEPVGEGSRTPRRRGRARRAAVALGAAVACALLAAPWAAGQQRGYELVTPADEFQYDADLPWDGSNSLVGANTLGPEAGAALRVTPDGKRVVWQTGGSVPGLAFDGELVDHLIATRTGGGWVSHAPLGDRSGVGCGFTAGPHFRSISPDGQSMLAGFLCAIDRDRFGGRDGSDQPLDAMAGLALPIYQIDVAADSARLLTPKLGPSGPVSRTVNLRDRYFGGSADFSTIYFASGAGLPDGVPDESDASPYLYRLEGGETRLLTRDAAGVPFGLRQVNPNPIDRPNAVSADAQTVTLTVPGWPDPTFNKAMVADDVNTVYDVYQVTGDAVTWVSDPEAVPVANRPADPQTAANRLFHGASADGERVFFATTERFTADDTDTALDVYMYDRGGGTATIERVSKQDAGPCAGCDDNASSTTGISHSNAKYVVSSDDGARLFLVTGDVLAEDDTDGQPSLYVRDVDGGATTYVAPAGAGVTSATNGADAGTSTTGSLVRLVGTPGPSFRERPIAISADGRTAVVSLATNVSLPAGRGGVDADATRDVFVWREGDGLRRVRQGPGPDDNTTAVPAHGCHDRASRPLCRTLVADDGTALFTTTDAIDPADTDGGRADVYAVSVADGTVELVTPPGDAAMDASYVDATPSGDSVFFATRERIDPTRDRDSERRDVYVARTGAVLPPLPEPEPPCDDAAGGCQPPPGGGIAEAPLDRRGGADADPGRRAGFTLLALSRAQRARLARGRPVALRVRVNQAGTVRARLAARLRGSARTVARGSRRAAGAATVGVRLRLSRPARRELRRRGRLAARLTVAFADRVPAQRRLVLAAPRTGGRR